MREIRFNENLRRLLLNSRISVVQASRESGVPKTTLYNYTTCHRDLPQLYVIAQLADYFGMTIDSLCFDDHTHTIFRRLKNEH